MASPPLPADTIAALATPRGPGALAVVRASGPLVPGLVAALRGGRLPAPRRATLTRYRDASGRLLDEVLLTHFAAPHSATGEDVLEISAHGNPWLVGRLLEDLLSRGCRPALPGEFTRRALLHGRIDLSQAEAVLDVVEARSEAALAAAQRLLAGELGRRIRAMVEALVELQARTEAYLDFPEEDLPPEEAAGVAASLAAVSREAGSLAATARHGVLARDGIRVALAGPPNAGKSSLLNRLCGAERALVHETPGTTRDWLEAEVRHRGYRLLFIDTAGLQATADPVEAAGVARSLEQVAGADWVWWVVDRSRPWVAPPPAVASALTTGAGGCLLNKCDLPAAADAVAAGVGPNPPRNVSARTGEGVAELLDALVAWAEAQRPADAPEGLSVHLHHATALGEARAALENAALRLPHAGADVLFAADLRAAAEALGRIVGRIDHEDVLDRLFARFCIGK